MATIDQMPNETARDVLESLGDGSLKYLLKVRSAVNDTDTELEDKAGIIDDPTADNIVTVDEDGDVQDSGYDLPTGSVVGTTDTQTLTNKTLTKPTVADLTNMTHDHKSAAKGGDYTWADIVLAATQADAVVAHLITDPADAPATADALRDDLVANAIPEIEGMLNALGVIVNALIDKLQTAKLMS